MTGGNFAIGNGFPFVPRLEPTVLDRPMFCSFRHFVEIKKNFTDMFLIARVISPSGFGVFGRREKSEREREKRERVVVGRVLAEFKKCEPSRSRRPRDVGSRG